MPEQMLGNACSGFASLLFLLRVVAVSKRNKLVIAFLGVVYLANWATHIRGAVLTETIYVPLLDSCGMINTNVHRLNITVSFVLDSLCCLVMIFYLTRGGTGTTGGLWGLLRNQGLVYMASVSIAYIVPVTFLYLDLNDAMNWMFEPVILTIMVICSTRLYRDLSTFDKPLQISHGKHVSSLRFGTAPSRHIPRSETEDSTAGGTTDPTMQFPLSKLDGASVIDVHDEELGEGKDETLA